MAFRKVVEFKEASLAYSSNGTATFQFYTDMPGNALAARKGAGVTMPSTTATRKTQTIPLDSIEGTLFYPEITPGAATQMKLYEGTVWVRPIGVYIDGSIGEVWRPQPQAVGV
jgi:hypothetical protein